MKRMKMLKTLLMGGAFILTLFLYSCLEDNDNVKGIADVVSIYPDENGSFYLKTDDKKTLAPINRVSLKPEKAQLARVVYTITEQIVEGFDYGIMVYNIDTILTKSIVPDLGPEDNDAYYGNDEVTTFGYEIVNGFLSLYFGTYWGKEESHFVNLVYTGDEEDPYQAEFRHNRFNDPTTEWDITIVGFDLSGLPDTEGETVELTLTVNEYQHKKVYKLLYNSDPDFIILPQTSNEVQASKYNEKSFYLK